MSHLIVSVADAVAKISINNPEHGNRIDMAMIRELTQLFHTFSQDQSVKVIHLTGHGADFSNGRLVPPANPDAPPKTALEVREQVTDPILGLYTAIRNAQIPVVASIPGAAHGLGCGLAVLCDITLASSAAKLSLPEMRTNLPPTLAISAVMHAVSFKALSHLIYTTDEIDAQTAYDMGMLSQVLPAETFEQDVAAYLAKLTSRRRAALSAVKEYLNLGPRLDNETAARYASNLLSTVLSSK